MQFHLLFQNLRKNLILSLKKISFIELFVVLIGVLSLLWQILFFSRITLSQYAGVVAVYLTISSAIILLWVNSKHFTAQRWKHIGTLFAFSIILCILYLFINRPDADDSRYLRMSLDAIILKETPIQDILMITEKGRALHGFEMTRAAIALLLPVPVLITFYTVIPIVFVCLIPFIFERFVYLVLNISKPSLFYSIFGIFLFICCTWADRNQTPPNMLIIRFYQAKPIFISLFAPIQFILIKQLIECANTKNLLLVILASASGVFFTSYSATTTGLILMLFIISFLFLNPVSTIKKLPLVSLSILYLVLIVFLQRSAFPQTDDALKSHIGESWYTPPLTTDSKAQFNKATFLEFTPYLRKNHSNFIQNYWEISKYFGFSPKGLIAILSIFYMTRYFPCRIIRVYSTLILIVLLLPISGFLWNTNLYPLSWRWLWSFPILFFFPWVIFDFVIRVSSHNKKVAVLFVVSLISLYTLTGRSIFHSHNGTSPGTKLEFSLIKLHSPQDMNVNHWKRRSWIPQVDGYHIIYKNQKF